MSAGEAKPNEPKPKAAWWSPLSWPLYVRVVLGVMIGAVIGYLFPAEMKDGVLTPRVIAIGRFSIGWTTQDLGSIATLYIQLLTALATPLVFFAVVEAFVRTNITGRQGLKMFAICLVNIAVAFAIGLTILNVFQPGAAWQSKVAAYFANNAEPAETEQAEPTKPKAPASDLAKQVEGTSLSPLAMVKKYVPKSLVQPFAENTVLTVAVLAILVGAALRSLKTAGDEELHPSLVATEHVIIAGYQIIVKMLMWLIELAPYAICLAVIGVVGMVGIETFKMVGVFFLTVTTALCIHAFIYYPLSAWLIGGKSPLLYFREGVGAILTGFSLNSSLATVPLTLAALERLRVSDSSARLSACVGTNFNNDGITLYEAMTALFIAQAAGMELSLTQQITILLAALVGSMGIAGIPNSGLIILSLVLKAAMLPDALIEYALPIVYSIDFIVARLRSAVNVMGDLQVAILLDAGGPAPELETSGE
ncbi:dicarboxylate/amino acid:cation symporter [Anatilimnocola sp. NA78]|uniref:dicarboxylate/amino acid:cation symporter n=1 Tax=Anatilimnocola sp. NA78 TaxID=3415683 RepID=UPI003CE4C1F0